MSMKTVLCMGDTVKKIVVVMVLLSLSMTLSACRPSRYEAEDKKIHEKFSLIFSLITFYTNLQPLTFQTQKCWTDEENRKQ